MTPAVFAWALAYLFNHPQMEGRKQLAQRMLKIVHRSGWRFSLDCLVRLRMVATGPESDPAAILNPKRYRGSLESKNALKRILARGNDVI